MAETLVKTCGITTPEDAVRCLEAGADYLGFVFAFSPRHVTVEQVEAIREVVPDARAVGVFLDEKVDAVLEVAESCRLDLIQLHGSEDPAYCEALGQRSALPIVKAIHKGRMNGENLEDYASVHGFLFDLPKGDAAGPEAREDLWSQAAQAARFGHRVFLAGGLDPDNVAAAVQRVHPFCVDVARGVERAPGVKDSALVRRFVDEVRRA